MTVLLSPAFLNLSVLNYAFRPGLKTSKLGFRFVFSQVTQSGDREVTQEKVRMILYAKMLSEQVGLGYLRAERCEDVEGVANLQSDTVGC